jgi:hypothetical protein
MALVPGMKPGGGPRGVPLARPSRSGIRCDRPEQGPSGNTYGQARRGGFVTERAALAEYRRLSRLRDARQPRPRLSDTVQTLCEDWLRARVQELQPNTVYNYGWLLGLIYPSVGRVRASRFSARMVECAYQQLEAAGYSRTTLRTLNLVLESVRRTDRPYPRRAQAAGKRRPTAGVDPDRGRVVPRPRRG